MTSTTRIAFTGASPRWPSARLNLLEPTTPQKSSAVVRQSLHCNTTVPDRMPQRLLDEVLWKSAYGPRAKVPPAGPHADAGE